MNLLKSALKNYQNIRFRKMNNTSIDYWRKRYINEGTSGAGASAELADFKSKVINNLIKTNNILSVIEFGCGEGIFLKNLKLNKYIGLDVSEIAIRKCAEEFSNKDDYSFFIYNPYGFFDKQKLFISELSLSLDVIYLIIEDTIFEKYMRDLFNSAIKFVVIFSTNHEESQYLYIKNRKFTDWIVQNIPGWNLKEIILSKSKIKTTNSDLCNFYIYEKLI